MINPRLMFICPCSAACLSKPFLNVNAGSLNRSPEYPLPGYTHFIILVNRRFCHLASFIKSKGDTADWLLYKMLFPHCLTALKVPLNPNPARFVQCQSPLKVPSPNSPFNSVSISTSYGLRLMRIESFSNFPLKIPLPN